MSMTTMTTTTKRDRGDRYGPMEWAHSFCGSWKRFSVITPYAKMGLDKNCDFAVIFGNTKLELPGYHEVFA